MMSLPEDWHLLSAGADDFGVSEATLLMGRAQSEHPLGRTFVDCGDSDERFSGNTRFSENLYASGENPKQPDFRINPDFYKIAVYTIRTFWPPCRNQHDRTFDSANPESRRV
jgi:hypothetical protein